MATNKPRQSRRLQVPEAPLEHIGELTHDPKNARKHGQRNVSTITTGLKDFGAARSIVIDEDGVILAGNATVEAAAKAGITKVHVVEADGATIVAVRRRGLTADQKTRLALFDNRAAELAEGWDLSVLGDIQAAGVSLDGLWSEDELVDLLSQLPPTEGKTDPDAVPEGRPTDIAVGDMFELGRHRIICGDSTNPEYVGRLLADDVPVLMVTDPPYGIDYDPSWRAEAGVNKNRKKLGKVLNDDVADWGPAWDLFPGEIAYVYHAALKSSIVQASLERAGFVLRSQIIWSKDRMALSRGDYHWQHEPCWYAVRSGKKGHRNDDRSQTTLWPIPAREDSGHGHGTQKPVECMARPMRNHTAQTVYEPFSGSGTTLIAGQMLGRQVLACELSPQYVQIAIDRWEAFTGDRAVKCGEAVHA